MRVVKMLYHPAGHERIEIFERDNGTFGFDLFKYDAEEDAWCQWGLDSHAITDTAERAEIEARGRIDWLRSAGDVGL